MEIQTTARAARSGSTLRALLATGAVGLVLAGALGYALGTRASDIVHLTGLASVGNRVASIEAGGSYYGVSESVAWVDASGSYHHDGWPECFGTDGTTTPVRFGATDVTVPGGGGWRLVIYVDCRSL